jgi:hypothetical protein
MGGENINQWEKKKNSGPPLCGMKDHIRNVDDLDIENIMSSSHQDLHCRAGVCVEIDLNLGLLHLYYGVRINVIVIQKRY